MNSQQLNYSGQDLRGKSFAGQDLRDANFRGADIRGTTFKDANLEGADFSEVIAGAGNTFISSTYFNIFSPMIPIFLFLFIILIIISFLFIFFIDFKLIHFVLIIPILLIMPPIFINMWHNNPILLHSIFCKLKFFREHSPLKYMYKTGSSNSKQCMILSTFLGLSNTNFQKANLKNVNFTNANLEETYFNKAKLTGVIWKNAKGLHSEIIHLCENYFNYSILAQQEISKLLVTEDGKRKNYTGSNISGANLRGFDLRKTNLTKVIALGTNFSNANLTGICIKYWEINSETKFDDVICDYIYLDSKQQKRYPPKPNNFKPGDFAKIFQYVGETIDLFFCEGIDWQVFLASFNELKKEYQDFSVHSFEQKIGGVFVVKLNALQEKTEQEKNEVYNYFNEIYDSKLKLIEQEYQQKLLQKTTELEGYKRCYYDSKRNGANIAKITKTLAQNQKIYIKQENKQVSNDYKGMTTNISDNAIVTFGNISGTVAQTINQLSQDSDKETLKELLIKLQTLIEKAEELEQETKIDALNNLNTLAKASMNPNLIGKQSSLIYFEELAQASIASALGGEINKLMLGIGEYF